MRLYLPLTSFIGYLRRCSPWPCSRSAAPLAQCAPILIGESNTGSWRTHTPFCTMASLEQPTEQCEHTVRRTSSLPSVPAAAAASAFFIIENGNDEANAPAPATMPERFRNARRSMVPMVLLRVAAKPAACSGCASRDDENGDDFLVSSIAPPGPGSRL